MNYINKSFPLAAGPVAGPGGRVVPGEACVDLASVSSPARLLAWSFSQGPRREAALDFLQQAPFTL